MKWEPWADLGNVAREKLNILEPPCKECHYWDPHVEFDRLGEATGVRCCVAESMHSDFSCYQPQPSKVI